MKTLSPDQIAALLKRDKTPGSSVGYESGVAGRGVFDNTADTGRPALTSPRDTTDMIYCDFCKGWYYEEYHYGDREGGDI